MHIQFLHIILINTGWRLAFIIRRVRSSEECSKSVLFAYLARSRGLAYYSQPKGRLHLFTLAGIESWSGSHLICAWLELICIKICVNITDNPVFFDVILTVKSAFYQNKYKFLANLSSKHRASSLNGISVDRRDATIFPPEHR